MAFNAVTDAVLLADIRTQLAAQVPGIEVSAQLGTRAGSAGKHQRVEVLEVRSARQERTYANLPLMKAPREVFFQGWFAVPLADTDTDAADFLQSCITALVGPFEWSQQRQVEHGGHRLWRERGFYRFEFSIISNRAMPQGSAP